MRFGINALAMGTFAYSTEAFTTYHSNFLKTSLEAMNGANALDGMNYLNGINSDARPYRIREVETLTELPSMRDLGLYPSTKYGTPRATKDLFDEIEQVNVQGGSLRTCSFNEGVNRVTVLMKSDGRPLNADVDLWHGPDNAPQKMAVYLEDGGTRPFRAIVETPGSSNAVSIRNTGQLEYPLTAGLELESGDISEPNIDSDYRIVQGGAVYTMPFPPAVQSLRVSLKTDGRPLNARIEMLQGPNNSKQVMEIYSEDGLRRPFNAVVDTPGSGNVVRIVNIATVEFPLSAALEPYIIDDAVRYDPSNPTGMVWS